MVGASLEEVEEEEEAEEEGAVSAPKEGCFKVIGTVKDKSSPKPSFVKEILSVRMLVYFVKTVAYSFPRSANHKYGQRTVQFVGFTKLN